jgi:hypothetical protein
MKATPVIKAMVVSGLLTLAAIALGGCAPPSPPPETTPVEMLQTQAAQTVIAGVTETAVQTSIPVPSATPTTTATPTQEPSATPNPTSTATASVQASPTPVLTIILEDDFSSQTGWATQNEADFGFDYLDDGYTIYVKLLNAAIWSIRGPESLSDVRVETDARRYSGAVDGYYGVVCRHSDGDNYYALMISDDLSYGIANMVDGKFEFITELKDERNIIKPNDINRIAGECIGSRISLYVNGEELLSLNDTTHQTGSAGLVAKTRFTPDFQAFYEYFSLAIP